MAIKLGSTNFGQIYLGSVKIGEAYYGATKVFPVSQGLPPYTMRLRYKDGFTPQMGYGTLRQVSVSPNIWDYTYNDTSWHSQFGGHEYVIEVIDGNTTGITDMSGLFDMTSDPDALLERVALFDTSTVQDISSMFAGCKKLTTIPLFDTSSARVWNGFLGGCRELTALPLFDTHLAVLANDAFANCPKVRSGALALYQAMSTNGVIWQHARTFENCGSNGGATGQAELAQIPSDWK
jgi:hypothetical protein